MWRGLYAEFYRNPVIEILETGYSGISLEEHPSKEHNLLMMLTVDEETCYIAHLKLVAMCPLLGFIVVLV